MVAAVIWLANAIGWIVVSFFPTLIKKFGVGAIKMAIQKSVSVFLVLTTIAFYGMILVFISESLTRFKVFIEILNNPSSQISGGEASEAFGCFLNLMSSSGIASGFNSAMSVLISVLMFFFLSMLYKTTVKSLKLISDEINKSLKLI